MDLGRDSKARLVILCICVMLLVWVVGFGFDRLLARDGVTRVDILILSNALTGIVAGFLFSASPTTNAFGVISSASGCAPSPR